MINEISDETKLEITSINFENKVWAFPQLHNHYKTQVRSKCQTTR